MIVNLKRKFLAEGRMKDYMTCRPVLLFRKTAI